MAPVLTLEVEVPPSKVLINRPETDRGPQPSCRLRPSLGQTVEQPQAEVLLVQAGPVLHRILRPTEKHCIFCNMDEFEAYTGMTKT